MTVPVELTERSYYTIIMDIRICVLEEVETSLALQYAAKCEKIRIGLKYIGIMYLCICACYIHILYLRINCARNSSSTMIYIVNAAIKEHIMQ